MAFGVTPNGFNLKRLTNIKREIETDLIDTLGLINTDPESVFGQIIGVLSSREADIWERLQDVYNSQYPRTASGVALDDAVALTGILRLPATPANIVCQLEGSEGTIVPAGSQVSASILGFTAQSLVDVEITQDNLHQLTFTVDNNSEANYTVSIDAESVVSIAQASADQTALQIATDINNNATLSSKLTASSSANTVTLTINDTDDTTNFFTLSTLSTDLTLQTIHTPVLTELTVNGAISVPIGAVDTIDTPVVGWDAVNNLATAFGGRDIETDDELRARQQTQLQTSGGATAIAVQTRILNEVGGVNQVFVFENDSEIVDAAGRPPHSIEVVVSGGTEAEISQKLWDVKPAGISTVSTADGDVSPPAAATGNRVSQVVLDVNGDSQTVYFSRPTNVEIYLDVVTTENTEETRPSDYITRLKQAFVDYGATLQIGQDVILQKFNSVAFSTVSGLETVITEGGTTVSPTAVDKVVIAGTEVAKFDISRITVDGV